MEEAGTAREMNAAAGSLAWEIFTAGCKDVINWQETTQEGQDILRHAVAMVAANASFMAAGEHVCAWMYRAHEVEEVPQGAGIFSGVMQAAQGKYRTLVLQRCDGCGDLRVQALAGSWDTKAVCGLNAEGGGTGAPA